jgi:hypothetical protein
MSCRGVELMMGKLPSMSISDQFDHVLAIIIAECGEQWLNMSEDPSLLISFDCVFLLDCVWRQLGLFLWAPMASQTGCAKAFVVRKNKATLVVEEAVAHYQCFVPLATKEAMQPLEDEVKLIQS